MCYRPVHIWNNSNHYDHESMPLQMDVPCGHCEDCQRSKQSEWFVRNYYHWLQIKEHGGDGFFYTLTWNDDNIPYTLIDGKKVTHFSLSQVQSFIKRLKERIRSKYGSRLDYCITCEFGHLFSRPHLHAVFYVNHGIMPHILYNEINDSWPYGFVYAGRNGGRLDNYTGILYVTKYITKDIAFANHNTIIYNYYLLKYRSDYKVFMSDNPFMDCPPTFDELLKNRNYWTDKEDVIKWVHDFKRDVRERCPFVSHSTKLGYGLLQKPQCIQFDSETCLIPMGKQFVPVSLPRFIKRALWYDRVPNERDGKLTDFRLNEQGRRHLLSILDKKIEKRTSDLCNFFTGLQLTDGQFQRLSTKLPFQFEGNRSFNIWLRMLDVDYRKLAIYSIVYRYRVRCDFSTPTDYYYQLDYFNDYKEFYQLALYTPPIKERNIIKSYDVKSLNYIYGRLYNHLPAFSLYEEMIQMYQFLQYVIREDYHALRNQRVEIQRKTREVIKNSVLKIA